MTSQLANQASQATINSVGAVGSVDLAAGANVAPTGFYFFAIDPITDIVVTVQVDVTNAVTADLTSFTSIGKTVYGKWTSITLNTDNEAIGYLSRL
jgi:hypothetical protein